MSSSVRNHTTRVIFLLVGIAAPLNPALSQKAEIPAPPQAMNPGRQGRDLQLEVFINDTSTGLIGAFKQLPDGSLIATSDEVQAVGLKPAQAAIDVNGFVHLIRLTGVSYRLDEANQTLYVAAANEARAARVIDVRSQAEASMPEPQRSHGGVVNYTLFASSDAASWHDLQTFPNLSAELDSRYFSPYGTLSQSVIASTAAPEFGRFPTLDASNFTRLQTTWAYSDTDRLMSYRAGDVISGGLSWTRPVWLGGLQVERNFGLRPDLVTLPLPALSGTAAVPSTLDVYTQNVRAFTGAVPAGPFEITNLPVTTGAGTARLVLHDALGRDTVTTLPFYTSVQLLRQGLYDFSAEVGVPRRYYGLESNNYDDRIMGSGSVRYGWANWLTLEGHAEGGDELLNGGAGAVFPLGARGVTSLALAGSSTDSRLGGQYSASLELGYWGLSLYVHTQRTFGDYEDVASITANNLLSFNQPVAIYDGVSLFNVRPPKTLDQVSLSMPLPFDSATLNLSFSQIEEVLGDRSRIVGLSYNRPFFRSSSVFASAFADLDTEDSFGVYAGISVPFGSSVSTSAGVESGPNGMRFATSAGKSEQQENGSYGWYVRDGESSPTADRSAGLSYRASFARVGVGVQQWDKSTNGTAEVDGSVALLGGNVFFANRIDDAFAVVDVGAPNVTVQYENRPIGETDSRGVLLVPYLSSFQNNKISIDPKNLPIDADVPTTRAVVVPADRGGVLVKFGIKETSQAALVTFVDNTGKPVGVGAQGRFDESAQTFVIGYDGQTYLSGLSAQNLVTIELPDGSSCRAAFGYGPRPGEQVTIDNVVCR